MSLMNVMRNIKTMSTEDVATKREVEDLRIDTLNTFKAIVDDMHTITESITKEEQGPVIDEEFELEKELSRQATEKQQKMAYKLMKTMQEHNIIYDKKYTGRYIYNIMTFKEAKTFIELYKPICSRFF